MKGQLLKLGLVGASLYLISTGISYAAFSTLSPVSGPQVPELAENQETQDQKHFEVDPSLPRTQECPINGKLFTQQEEDLWVKRRPIFAMIENSTDARPQSGLSFADVIYEAIAEGGITRFGAVLYCGSAYAQPTIAPVRSFRIYFGHMASEYANPPILLHVGGANNYGNDGSTVEKVRALEFLSTIKWRVPGGIDFDTTYDMALPVFSRNENRLDRPVAVEHTMEARLDKATEQAAKRGWTNVSPDGDEWNEDFRSWVFADDAPKEDRPSEFTVEYAFSSNFEGDFTAKWVYDPQRNVFYRHTGGQPHKDLLTDKQLEASVVIVQFTKEEVSIDANLHMYYEMLGTGKALVFQNGKAIPAKWSKKTRTDRTVYTDEKTGKEISFVRGPIWISILGNGRTVDYGSPATP